MWTLTFTTSRRGISNQVEWCIFGGLQSPAVSQPRGESTLEVILFLFFEWLYLTPQNYFCNNREDCYASVGLYF